MRLLPVISAEPSTRAIAAKIFLLRAVICVNYISRSLVVSQAMSSPSTFQDACESVVVASWKIRRSGQCAESLRVYKNLATSRYILADRGNDSSRSANCLSVNRDARELHMVPSRSNGVPWLCFFITRQKKKKITITSFRYVSFLNYYVTCSDLEELNRR